MKLEEIKRQIKDMKKRYGLTHSRCIEEEVDGEVRVIDFHVRYRVDSDKKNLDPHK